ncbi:TfuA-like protein [Methanosarcina horonobensis]
MGIIDGIFFDRAAVGHREIISALNAGVKVVGGAAWELSELLNLTHTA